MPQANLCEYQKTRGPQRPRRQKSSARTYAWSLRASAYNQMLEAYRNSDTSIFDSAEKTNNTSKTSEESYFGQINRYFSTVNLKLIQFPRGG